MIKELESYEHSNLAKFVGAGLPNELLARAPKLCSRLWLELDIVPIANLAEVENEAEAKRARAFWSAKCVDEQADSMARKCIM